jgi:hypothetical protein
MMDGLVLAIQDDDGQRELARLDGGYLSTWAAGGFVGRTAGLRAAVADDVLFSRAEYTPPHGAGRSVQARAMHRSSRSRHLAVQVHFQVHEGKEGIQ